jgi:antitoxin component YwqK of YwqJK toxin-antitoxin module
MIKDISLKVVITLLVTVFSCRQKQESREYYRNGNVKSIKEFRNGQLHGKYTSYYLSGTKESEEEYRNGKLFGSMILYYENGDTTELVRFLEHGKEGEQRLYFPGNRVKMTLGWMHDYREGPERHYLESGLLSVCGNYKGGVKDSIWTFYDSTGKIQTEEYWRMGILDSTTDESF